MRLTGAGCFRWTLATGFPLRQQPQLRGWSRAIAPFATSMPIEAASALEQPVPVAAAPATQITDGLRLPKTQSSHSQQPGTKLARRAWRRPPGSGPARVAVHPDQRISATPLTPPPLVGAHRMDEFLFETREGANTIPAAFVVLMPVPACRRGWYGLPGGSFNDIGDYWLIRNSDAHAWPKS